jgi:hypothetical protein
MWNGVTPPGDSVKAGDELLRLDDAEQVEAG